ncbi:MAG: hypothetical protein KAT28_02795 [Candidatus Aenigmarchaeota archaeon]|nr:hypothetical protein [Candidatus Aenigmarchaeota archaeon]
MSNKIISAGEIGYDGNLADSIERMIEDVESGDVYRIYFKQLSIEPPYFLEIKREYSSDLGLKLEIETSKQQTEDICSKLPEYLVRLKEYGGCSFINTGSIGERADGGGLWNYRQIRYVPFSELSGLIGLPEDIKGLFYTASLNGEQRRLAESYKERGEQTIYTRTSEGKCILPDNQPYRIIRNESELSDDLRRYENIQLYTITNNTDMSSLWLNINKFDKRDHIELDVSAPKETSQEGPDLLGPDYFGDLLEVLEVEINPEAEMKIEKPCLLRQTSNKIKRFVS